MRKKKTSSKILDYYYDSISNVTNHKEYAYTTGTLGSVQSSVNYIHGDALTQNKIVKDDIYIPETTTGRISIYTASPSTIVELVSPNGTVIPASKPTVDEMIFSGASLYTFEQEDFAKGIWTVQMKATDPNDAYLLTSTFNEKEKYSLNMPGTGKADQTAFTINTPKQQGTTSLSFKFIDKDGNELKQNVLPTTTNGNDFSAKLPKVSQPGVYNMTVDIKTKHPDGHESVRTLVRSIYID